MFVPARKTMLGLVLAAGLLLGVTSAQAANPIQNPSFTDDCSGVPCHWSASVGGLARDTTTFHSSPASAKLSGVSVGGVFNGALVSDCFTLDPGIYLTQFWFLTANFGRGPASIQLLHRGELRDVGWPGVDTRRLLLHVGEQQLG